MSAKLIEDGWQVIEQAYGGFCCDGHRSVFRAMYFAGAMDVMEKAAGFNPEMPNLLLVDTAALASVAVELALMFCATDLAANLDVVRH